MAHTTFRPLTLATDLTDWTREELTARYDQLANSQRSADRAVMRAFGYGTAGDLDDRLEQAQNLEALRQKVLAELKARKAGR